MNRLSIFLIVVILFICVVYSNSIDDPTTNSTDQLAVDMK